MFVNKNPKQIIGTKKIISSTKFQSTLDLFNYFIHPMEEKHVIWNAKHKIYRNKKK